MIIDLVCSTRYLVALGLATKPCCAVPDKQAVRAKAPERQDLMQYATLNCHSKLDRLLTSLSFTSCSWYKALHVSSAFVSATYKSLALRSQKIDRPDALSLEGPGSFGIWHMTLYGRPRRFEVARQAALSVVKARPTATNPIASRVRATFGSAVEVRTPKCVCRWRKRKINDIVYLSAIRNLTCIEIALSWIQDSMLLDAACITMSMTNMMHVQATAGRFPHKHQIHSVKIHL